MIPVTLAMSIRGEFGQSGGISTNGEFMKSPLVTCFTRAIVRATSLPSDCIHILKRIHVERNNSIRHVFSDLEKKLRLKGFVLNLNGTFPRCAVPFDYISEKLRFSIVATRLS